jgi:hypothetical protein
MIRILHFFPGDNHMIADYVTMLSENMGLECSNELVSEQALAEQRLRSSHYDILHLHGCWNASSYFVGKQAIKNNTRIVLSANGQLSPWVMSNHYLTEKLPKRLLYQKQIIKKAYAVIVQGKMEESCVKKLGWNKRLVTIKNPQITRTISRKSAASQVFDTYCKVMNSNPLELMDEDMCTLLQQLILLGNSGDKRWLDVRPMQQPDTLEQWKHLLCYAHFEHIDDVIRRGLNVMNYEAPDMDVKQMPCFYPDHYVSPVSINETIGFSFISEVDRLMAIFHYLRKLVSNRELAVSHLVELDRELREHECDEDLLAERLKDERLYKLAARVMFVTQQVTGLTEGFMPIPPLADRTSRQLYSQVENHLKI